MTARPKLLIAEGDSELRAALKELFSHSYQVRTCGDGCQARELIQNFQPDLLLLDLMLPAVDGITLLGEIPESQRPLTMAVTLFTSPYIQAAMQQLQVSFLFLKPLCISAVADRMQELATTVVPVPPVTVDPEERLYRMLRDMGLAPRADGFSYLMEGIPLYIQDPRQALTKELYPQIGRKFQKSAASVERSIRSVIEGAWRRGGYRDWDLYFRTLPDGAVAKPSNSEFLSALAMYLVQQEKECNRTGCA